MNNVHSTNDPYRLKFHLMPPQGWLNDPNGLCYYAGNYHVFFQYSPDNPNGGDKYWGHYISSDLIHWEFKGITFCPDTEYDKDGVYSGSALVKDNKMYLFYTGNVKEPGEHDYIYTGRQANTIMAVSQDGYSFSDKICVLQNKDYPEYYTCHIRDPKIWQQNGKYYMIQGGRIDGSKKRRFVDDNKLSILDAGIICGDDEDKGAVLIFESDDLREWKFKSDLTIPNKFGYMWECPDYFELGDACILSVSPQGLETQKYKYQNIYQSGYFLVDGNIAANAVLGDFVEWDMGFDFYAPQTFEDHHRRRILIGWAGIPDADYDNEPTVVNGWQHTLTLPRELTMNNGKVYQNPVTEINSMRGEKVLFGTDGNVDIDGVAFDMVVDNIQNRDIVFAITGKDSEAILRVGYINGIFGLEFAGEYAEDIGRGRTVRRVLIEEFYNMRVIVDASIIEVYINDGEYVVTSRYYIPDENRHIYVDTFEDSNDIIDNTTIWMMDK